MVPALSLLMTVVSAQEATQLEMLPENQSIFLSLLPALLYHPFAISSLAGDFSRCVFQGDKGFFISVIFKWIESFPFPPVRILCFSPNRWELNQNL